MRHDAGPELESEKKPCRLETRQQEIRCQRKRQGSHQGKKFGEDSGSQRQPEEAYELSQLRSKWCPDYRTPHFRICKIVAHENPLDVSIMS